MKRSWGDVYRSALRRGQDHGYAAYLADQWEKRKAKAMNNRTEDFMNAARERVSEVTLDLIKRADSKEQAMHIAIAAATGALGTAAGALAAFRGSEAGEIDHIGFAREVLEMMEAARS